jgi:hypothetical protein
VDALLAPAAVARPATGRRPRLPRLLGGDEKPATRPG